MSRGEQIVYGVHPVRELLRSDRPISALYLTEQRRGIEAVHLLARQRNVPVQILSKEQMDRLTRTTKHQAVAASVSSPLYYDLHALLALVESRPEPPFLFLLDAIVDPRNFGAILRVAEAAGVQGVLFLKRRAVGVSPIVSKASAGAEAHLPLARVANLSYAIDRLKEKAIQIIGLSAQSSLSYLQSDFSNGVAIVVGGEGEGLHQKIRKQCDQILSVPMRGAIASLNVSVAVGIVAYEVLRQRKERERPA